MKKKLCLALTWFVLGCSTPPSDKTVSSADTVKVDTNTVEAQPVAKVAPDPPPLVISDSSAKALSDLVNAQFEAVALALADSANYYQVRLEDYFDEWEGQSEIKQTTWYFDKEFSMVYAKHSYQNGAMDKPDVIEFILKKNLIACTKEDVYNSVYNSNGMWGRSLILWDAQAGGVQLNYSTNANKIVSQESIADDYNKANNNTLEIDYNLLDTMLDLEDYSPPEGKEIYTILKEVPKASELVDYTMVIIPKVMYDKLKSNTE